MNRRQRLRLFRYFPVSFTDTVANCPGSLIGAGINYLGIEAVPGRTVRVTRSNTRGIAGRVEERRDGASRGTVN